MSFYAAVAQADITPPLGLTMAGYASRTHGAEDVADPLYAQALALSDGSRTAAIVSLDLCSFGLEAKDAMRDRAAERTGLDPRAIVISTTHTHFGPMVDPSAWLSGELRETMLPEYRENLIAVVAGLIEDAWRRLESVRLLVGSAKAVGISFNRRPLTPEGGCANRLRLSEDQASVASAEGYGLYRKWRKGGWSGPSHAPSDPRVEGLCLGVTDPEVVVLRVETQSGVPLAAAVNFACHPVCGGSNLYAVSADYPGEMRWVLARELGVPSLFLLGAAGDQVPAWREGDARRRVGQSLGGAAVSAWHRAREVEGPLGVASVTAELPLRSFEPVDRVQARLEALTDPSVPEAWRDRYELEMAKLFGCRASLPNEVQAIAAGEWGLVTGPCEILVEIGLHIKQKSPFAHTMFASLAGENLGYMPTDDALREGGYEATTTALGSGAGAALIAGALEALRAARST